MRWPRSVTSRVGVACWLGIMARLVQASEQHRQIMGELHGEGNARIAGAQEASEQHRQIMEELYKQRREIMGKLDE